MTFLSTFWCLFWIQYQSSCLFLLWRSSFVKHRLRLLLFTCFKSRIRLEPDLFRICLENTINDSISWNKFEVFRAHLVINLSFLILRVIIRTLSFFATWLLTFLSSIDPRMIMKFFPSMAHWTCQSIFTTFVIISDILLQIPIETTLK